MLASVISVEEFRSRAVQRDCRIRSCLEGVDTEGQWDWPRQHEWLAKRLNDLRRVFTDPVRSLDVESRRTEPGG
jgi:hypothetical protein